MTLIQLRQFVAIVDSRLNVTAAALRVHATQSGVSKQLKQFEDGLGFQLFTRRGRSLAALTPAGERVLDHARKALAEVANIEAVAANLRREEQGELSIATTHTQARYALPYLLSRLKKHFPGVVVHLAPGGDADSLARLARGEADMAIISTGGAVPEVHMALPLYRWERTVLVPPDHPLARQGTLTIADLARHPLVSYESSREPGSSLRRAFGAAGLEPEITLTARDGDLIKTYVREGVGVGIVAEMAVAVDDGDLVALPGRGLLPSCTTWLLLRRDRLLRDYSHAFIAGLMPHVPGNELRRALNDGVVPTHEPLHWQAWCKARAFNRTRPV
ncbi:LysR substrate-binding domain-containing protein [Lysobacter sp. A03]|uniref:LysR substrate-binding domain-containing protein n=1 Tax=Lysobacter sp. A03 TaxID=1199154 RepID=UPI0005B715B5|nr:LysR substrate-binding domain-containing protein [Lysobacter sp. A03]KIQ96353.1 Cys regulon transcriptional activator CysB [Lysobacter sp. A03]